MDKRPTLADRGRTACRRSYKDTNAELRRTLAMIEPGNASTAGGGSADPNNRNKAFVRGEAPARRKRAAPGRESATAARAGLSSPQTPPRSDLRSARIGHWSLTSKRPRLWPLVAAGCSPRRDTESRAAGVNRAAAVDR